VHLAASVLPAAIEQDAVEAWIRERARAGAPLRGLYPPSAETLAAFRAGTLPDAAQ
jgi:hypothetical protein